LNIARIGFVASEITKNDGIALCAPIAPYHAVRKQVRATIEPHGLPPRARLDPDRGVRAARQEESLRQGAGGDREGVHRGVGSLRGAAKSLELDPSNSNAARMIERLQKP
jgi:sulfate adenylyltransferase